MPNPEKLRAAAEGLASQAAKCGSCGSEFNVYVPATFVKKSFSVSVTCVSCQVFEALAIGAPEGEPIVVSDDEDDEDDD
jgi:hypothetical protein